MEANMGDLLVFVVDDNEEAFENISLIFGDYGIKSIHIRTYEELRNELPKYYDQLSAITLDILGLISDENLLPDRSFLQNALSYIENDAHYRNIPVYIITGSASDYDYISKFYKDKYPVILKSSIDEIEKAAKEIQINGQNLFRPRIRKKYENELQLIEKYFGVSKTQEVLENLVIAEFFSSVNNEEIKNSLSSMRRLLEQIISTIKKHYPIYKGFFGTHYFFSGQPNYFSGKKKYSKQYIYEDYVIQRAFKTVFTVTSIHGSHENSVLEDENIYIDSKHFPTPYTLKTIVYSLLDIILWYDRFMQEHSNKGE